LGADIEVTRRRFAAGTSGLDAQEPDLRAASDDLIVELIEGGGLEQFTGHRDADIIEAVRERL
jgi:hypothetical protein